MSLNDIQYVASGGTFLFVAVIAVRILLKLQLSGEQIYERRSLEQVATIRDLEIHSKEMRDETRKCHDERLKLTEQVAVQKVELAEQKIKLAALEAQVKLLSIVPAVAVVPQVAENVVTIKDRQTGQIEKAVEDANQVKGKLNEVLDAIDKKE